MQNGVLTWAIGCGFQEVHLLRSIFHGSVQWKLERRLILLENTSGKVEQHVSNSFVSFGREGREVDFMKTLIVFSGNTCLK